MKRVLVLALLSVAMLHQTVDAALRRTNQSLSSYGRNLGSSSLAQRAQSWWNAPSEQEVYPYVESTPVMNSIPKAYGSLSWSEMSPSQADVAQQAWYESEQALQKEIKRKADQRYARAVKYVGRILMLIAAAKTTELAVTFGFEKYNEKIIQDIQRPNTLSYKLAKIIQEKRWDDLKGMVWVLVDEVVEDLINIGLDNQIENTLNRQLNRLVDVKNTAIDGMKLAYFVYVLRLVSEHIGMYETVEIYVIYISQTWAEKHIKPISAQFIDYTLPNVDKVFEISDPAMLSFYMKVDQDYFENTFFILNKYLNILVQQSELSDNQKKCLNILLNHNKIGIYVPTDESNQMLQDTNATENWLDRWIKDQELQKINTVITKLDPLRDQRLIMKLENYRHVIKNPRII